MSIFENPGLDLKKRNIITYSASALPILRRGLRPLCFGAREWLREDAYHNGVVWVADVGMDGYGWVWMYNII
jgi:hypothetical protein